MYPHKPLRICTTCRIHHYDNCPDCAGFGMYRGVKDDQLYPVMAGEAHGFLTIQLHVYAPCAACGSTITGVPRVPAMLPARP